ncbi:MAG: hypothetical protein AAB451_03730 [Patescibacteria group bacterium]
MPEEIYKLMERGEIEAARKLVANFIPETIGDYVEIQVALAVIELPAGAVVL